MSATAIDHAKSVDPAIGRGLAQLREVSGKIAGRIFYGTMLRSMRESVLKGEYGHGGRGEDIFAAQLHGIFAERLGAAKQNPLAESLYRHLENQQANITRSRLQGGG
ncbi:MAG: hypothetical protein IH987_00580 [Planctomycetes bacterium]|nr:hypothetical protein [Planctomycetota bacterium]